MTVCQWSVTERFKLNWLLWMLLGVHWSCRLKFQEFLIKRTQNVLLLRECLRKNAVHLFYSIRLYQLMLAQKLMSFTITRLNKCAFSSPNEIQAENQFTAYDVMCFASVLTILKIKSILEKMQKSIVDKIQSVVKKCIIAPIVWWAIAH